MTLVPLAACLLLAGFGYLLSNIGGSSSSSGAVSAASPSSAASAPAAAPAPAAPGLPAEGGGSAGSVPGAFEPAAGPSPGSGGRTGFVVTASGTRYQRATLGLQVRHQMALQAASRSAEGQPTEGQRAAAGSAPSPSLAACVRRLTGNEPPSLVDRATYEGRPAYVIAVPARAWVVGLDCTAITSIPLPGPG